ncbi:MAG: 16S rRNA (adenine(1518)-N(6)/adenine(1519)-N(6))-dimethyltransferase RsmA [Dehalococcoidia bacterium]
MTEPRRKRPRKALGQHWLVDHRFLNRIAEAVHPAPQDTILEIGAGTGLLTEALASRTDRLIAVEVDPDLADRLRERFRDRPGVSVVAADVLAAPPEELLTAGRGSPPYIVVGNLPYFIGTAIIRHFLRAAVRPRRLLVTLQADVAERIAAGPGRMSYLSVETQLFAQAQTLFSIPAQAFRPPPKVRSAVLSLSVRDGMAVDVDDPEEFLSLVRAGFAAPRKRTRNSLSTGLKSTPAQAEAVLRAAGIDPGLRPALLSLADWARLYDAYRQPAAAGAE